MENVVEVRSLVKRFRRGFFLKPVEVLHGVSFSIRKGTITGFLGVNGSGKTTTIKCLLGLNHPDAGEINFFGEGPLRKDLKRRIGFLPERPYFYEYLTGEEFLRFYGRLHGNCTKAELKERVNKSLERVQMTEASSRQLRTYSKGMLQRIGIAQALLHEPEFVILDEPMSGLDPDGRLEVSQIIRETAKSGTAIFFSSHDLNDAEKLCDHLVILAQGKVAYEGKTEDLLETMQAQYFIRYAKNGEQKIEEKSNINDIQKELDRLRKSECQVIELGRSRHTLERAFTEIASHRVNR